MNVESPKISVVIPLYNKGEYIADTLSSVLAQTFQDFEVLVANDGSTDNGMQAVRAFADGRIKVLEQSNQGVSEARNHGIREARAPFIAFLDADDFWEPYYLQEMDAFIAQYPACGLYIAAHKVAEKDRVFEQPIHLATGLIPDYFKAELESKITRLSSTVVPRSVCQEAGCFPKGMVSGEDSYFCGKLAISYPVAFMAKPLVIYNQQYSGLANRSFKGDTCTEQWGDLLHPGEFYRNEFIASKALKAGVRFAMAMQRAQSRSIEQTMAYTSLFKKKWRYLYFLNRVPSPFIRLYKKIKPFLAK